jgi:hypothetical protein
LAIAASSPAWRQPPPTTLRQRRARSTSSALPSSIEPTGAPRPFEKQIETLSKPRATSRAGTPRAIAALYRRAPSRWKPRPCLLARARAAST